jgi:hypothetical protein
LALQREIYDETSANFDPYRQGGGLGFDAYLYEMGLGDAPMIGGAAPQIETYIEPGQVQPQATGIPGSDNERPNPFFGGSGYMPVAPGMGGQQSPGQTRYRVNGQTFATMDEAQAFANRNRTGGRAYGGFEFSPGYQFNLARGMDGLNSTAAMRGNLLSGANIAGAMQFNQGLANQEYTNYLNRLQGIGQQGQAAAGNQAAAGQAYASGAGNALAGIGNAQAAGAIGRGNAMSGMFDNLSSTFGYLNSQNRSNTGGTQNANALSAPWGSSGFWG